jgi:hypothetical protein
MSPEVGMVLRLPAVVFNTNLPALTKSSRALSVEEAVETAPPLSTRLTAIASVLSTLMLEASVRNRPALPAVPLSETVSVIKWLLPAPTAPAPLAVSLRALA